MATSLSVDLLASISTVYASGDAQNPGSVNPVLLSTAILSNGTGAGQADIVYSESRNLGAASSEVLDLAGVLSDAFGTTVAAARVIAFQVANLNSVDGDDLRIGPDATNGWLGKWLDASDRSLVPAGGHIQWYDPNGQAVTAGSADELFVDNQGGNPIDYSILIIAASA